MLRWMGGREKNKIINLEQDGKVIEGEKELMDYINEFYKNLFGQAETSNININIQGAEGFLPRHKKS